ncbi:MAG: ATP-binding protein [Hyphomicrobiaceae bacterium]|nr:ATP-binding protein [Hyphomicrobiaceae bacterium]
MSDARADVSHQVAAKRSELPPALTTLALLAVYVGLERLSFLHEHNDLPVTPWNPGLGVMFAMIILRGHRMGLVLFAGAFLGQVIVVRSELPWGVLLAMSAAIALSYTAVAAMAGRQLDLAPQLLRTRDILILVVAGLVGALAEATQLWLLLIATRHFHLADIGSTSLPLIIGDVIGIAVVTPLMLRIVAWLPHPPKMARAVLGELLLLLIAVMLVLYVVVRPPGPEGQSLFYLLFVPVVIAAVRHGIDGACTALAVTQLGLVAFLHWHGLELARFTEYQALMLVLTLTGLIVGGLVSERHAAQIEAEASRLRMRELEAQSARTARLNMASGMAAALAHEINQPMTAARALSRSVQELMRAPDRDPDRMERNLASMIEQIDHAGEVVKRMREFLRRGEPHISTLDIKTVLAEAVALMEPMVRSRKVQLRLLVPAGLPAVHGDRVQIGQVAINLIKNSIDAIPEDAAGRIDVSARATEDGKWVEVAVRDNGPGIAAAEVDALFVPLSTSRPDGIGLGLSICKTILHAHGGRIWLSSSAPGETEFRFALPAGRAGSGTTPAE